MGLVVHLRGAVCLLDRFPALAGVDLDAAAGEVVLLSGPNGAGKTTLLRALAGLVPFVRGEAAVCGHDLRRDRRAVRRSVGLLGHSSGLYPELTVAENLRFWDRASGGNGAGVVEALDRLGLERRLHGVTVDRLSAGQRRHVAVAGLVLRGPLVWLLDEPHAGLDAGGRDLLDAVVTDAARAGATILLASHELERATPLATRRVVVAGGQAILQNEGVSQARAGRRAQAVGEVDVTNVA